MNDEEFWSREFRCGFPPLPSAIMNGPIVGAIHLHIGIDEKAGFDIECSASVRAI